jgi:hypothetical protein
LPVASRRIEAMQLRVASAEEDVVAGTSLWASVVVSWRTDRRSALAGEDPVVACPLSNDYIQWQT